MHGRNVGRGSAVGRQQRSRAGALLIAVVLPVVCGCGAGVRGDRAEPTGRPHRPVEVHTLTPDFAHAAPLPLLSADKAAGLTGLPWVSADRRSAPDGTLRLTADTGGCVRLVGARAVREGAAARLALLVRPSAAGTRCTMRRMTGLFTVRLPVALRGLQVTHAPTRP